jgi:hypothetical protein
MKKLLLTTLIVGALAGSAFAQGLVSLAGKVYYSTVQGATTGTAIPIATPGVAGTWGQINVALVYSDSAVGPLFSATSASSLTGTWLQAAPVGTKVSSPGGGIAAVTATVGANASEESFVVGWTGTFLTWNAAWADGKGLFGWSGEAGLGSLGWQQANATSPSTPVPVNTGVAGFSGVVMMVV